MHYMGKKHHFLGELQCESSKENLRKGGEIAKKIFQ